MNVDFVCLITLMAIPSLRVVMGVFNFCTNSRLLRLIADPSSMFEGVKMHLSSIAQCFMALPVVWNCLLVVSLHSVKSSRSVVMMFSAAGSDLLRAALK